MEANKHVQFDEDNRIMCPLCNDVHLHHMRVDVGFRRMEDESGIVTKVTHESTTSSYEEHGHVAFSHRRDRITIHFYCECCGGGGDDDHVSRWIKMYIDQTDSLIF